MSRAERESGMKIWPSLGALMALSLAASLLALAAPAHAEKRVALVIGNNDSGACALPGRSGQLRPGQGLALTHDREPAIDGDRRAGDEV
jgi:hypothetical protein